MKRDLEIVRTYPHPPERLWFALTDSAAIADWLMENDFEPRVGHRFNFRTTPAPGFDGIVYCEVLEIVERSKLVFTWKGGPIDTVITFTLEAVADGTMLRVKQTGFSGLKAVLVSFILQSGNTGIYDRKLPSLLDRLASGAFAPGAAAGCDPHPGWPSLGVNALMHVTKLVPAQRPSKEPSSGDAPDSE